MPFNRENCFSCGSTEKLHPAPTCAEIRHKWIEAIPNAHPGIFTKDFRICQLHFNKSSVVFGRHLLRSAVPTLFEFDDDDDKPRDENRQPQTPRKDKVAKIEPKSSKKQPQIVRQNKIINSDPISPETSHPNNQPQPASEDEIENSDSDESNASSTVIIIEEVSEPTTDPLAIPDPRECSPPKSPELPPLQKLKRLKLRVPLTSPPQQIQQKGSPPQKIVQQTTVKRLQSSPVSKIEQPAITKHPESSQVAKSTTAKPVQISPVQKKTALTTRKRLADSPIEQIEQPIIRKRQQNSPVSKIEPRTTRNRPTTSKDSPAQKAVQPPTAKSLQVSSPQSTVQPTATKQKATIATKQASTAQPSSTTKSLQNHTARKSPQKLTKLTPVAATTTPTNTKKPITTKTSIKNAKTTENVKTTSTPLSSKTNLSKITYPLGTSNENCVPEGRIKIAEMSIERLKLNIERVNLRSKGVQKRINVLNYKINTYKDFIATLVAKNIISRESAKKFEVLDRDIKRKARRDAMKNHKQGRKDLAIDPVTDHDYL